MALSNGSASNLSEELECGLEILLAYLEKSINSNVHEFNLLITFIYIARTCAYQ